jgi:hypothetical protein
MIGENQNLERQVALSEDTTAYFPAPFMEGGPEISDGSSGSIGEQAEKFHPHAVKRLYLAIINRAILDVLEKGHEADGAEQWLLSSDFDRLQAAFD